MNKLNLTPKKFQFLIGKVQPLFITIEYGTKEKFQFLIGKVQRYSY